MSMITGTGADEGESPIFVGGLDGRILDVGECGTHDDNDDDEDINKSDVFLLSITHDVITGLSLIHLASERPPNTDAKELINGSTFIPLPTPLHPLGEWDSGG